MSPWTRPFVDTSWNRPCKSSHPLLPVFDLGQNETWNLLNLLVPQREAESALRSVAVWDQPTHATGLVCLTLPRICSCCGHADHKPLQGTLTGSWKSQNQEILKVSLHWLHTDWKINPLPHFSSGYMERRAAQNQNRWRLPAR